MFNLFTKYVSVGVINTAIHWTAFSAAFYLFSVNQATANFIAFATAVTFSFFANASFTFNVKPKPTSYLLFVSFMGILSILVGKLSDYYHIEPVITLIEFSLVSLVLGFIYSKYVVFRKDK